MATVLRLSKKKPLLLLQYLKNVFEIKFKFYNTHILNKYDNEKVTVLKFYKKNVLCFSISNMFF